MSRTLPVNTGYTILNGKGTGPNGGRIHVWAEYLVGQADTAGNRTWLTAYFYTALDPNYTSTTSYYNGLYSNFTVNGAAAGGVTNGAYDFTSPDKVHLLGSFSGWIGHDTDGTKTVTLEGSFTTKSTYISGGTLTGEVELPAIVQAPGVTAGDTTLGNVCHVTWTPADPEDRFRLAFSLGGWEYRVGPITPGVTRQYTYSGCTLPLEAARQFTGASAEMTVTLTAYRGQTELGQTRDTFTVTVPENNMTRPDLSVRLSPVCQAFPAQYVETLGKVSASVTALDPLGAEITGYTISTGAEPLSGTLSDYLDRSGEVTVTVTATNSRGFTGTFQQKIQVIPYETPRLLTATAYRCLGDGTMDPGGSGLRLTAGWHYSPVEGENICRLRWRYQPAGGTWSEWASLPGTNAVDTGPIPGITLEKNCAYTVALEAVDTAGGRGAAVFSIPVEQVYMHRTRDAMGLGGYADGADRLDVYWDIHARKGVNGIQIRKAELFATDTLCVQTMFSVMDGAGNTRQSVFLFGNDNGTLIQGVFGIDNAGRVTWNGTAGVSGVADTATGILTVTLPYVAYDRFVLLSADPLAVV